MQWRYGSFHLGAPVELIFESSFQKVARFVLGHNVMAGEHPQIAVPAFFSRSCTSLGPWSLLACTMSPGYTNRPGTFLAADI